MIQKTKKILLYFTTIVLCLLGGEYLFVNFYRAPIEIDGDSMFPTFLNGNKRHVNKLYYLFNSPQRFEIVIAKEKIYGLIVKRIVGLPNETLEIKQGVLYINNQIVEEDHIRFRMDTWNIPPTKIPENCYYLIGDNRSEAQMNFLIGIVNKNNIIGIVKDN